MLIILARMARGDSLLQHRGLTAISAVKASLWGTGAKILAHMTRRYSIYNMVISQLSQRSKHLYEVLELMVLAQMTRRNNLLSIGISRLPQLL